MVTNRPTIQQSEERITQQKQPTRISSDSHIDSGPGVTLSAAGLNARQSAVLRKQQTVGNAAVLRQLGLRSPGTSSATAQAIQRIPATDSDVGPFSTTQANSSSDSGGDSGAANTIQREPVTWTVPATVTAPMQAARSSSIETLAYAQQLQSSAETTAAGWTALVGTQQKGAAPEPVRASGAAARSQISGVKTSVGQVSASLDQAKAVLTTAVQQGGGEVAENNDN